MVAKFGDKVQSYVRTAMDFFEVGGVYARDLVLVSSFQPFKTDVMLGLSAIRLLGGVANSSARQRMFWGECVCDGEKRRKNTT